MAVAGGTQLELKPGFVMAASDQGLGNKNLERDQKDLVLGGFWREV